MASENSETAEVIQASGESTSEGATKKAQEQVYQLFNISLNIAVTGETGAGKSTFVNAIRGLKVNDKGAAPTGVEETTKEPTPYEHPTVPNVVLWDLPGIGSPNFKAKTYLKQCSLIADALRHHQGTLWIKGGACQKEEGVCGGTSASDALPCLPGSLSM